MTFVVGLTYFMTQKGQGVNRGHLDLLYDPKGHGDPCGSLTEFITPKCHGVISSRRDLLYDSKGHGDLFGRYDPVDDPKK